MTDPTISAPSLWIRRSVFGRHGEGESGCQVEDTNDHWIRLAVDEDGGHGRLMCWGCNELVDVHMPDPDRLIAECVECGRTYKVEVN